VAEKWGGAGWHSGCRYSQHIIEQGMRVVGEGDEEKITP